MSVESEFTEEQKASQVMQQKKVTYVKAYCDCLAKKVEETRVLASQSAPSVNIEGELENLEAMNQLLDSEAGKKIVADCRQLGLSLIN